MKYLTKKYSLRALGLAVGLLMFSLHGCKDHAIQVKTIDESNYGVSNESIGFLAGADGKLDLSNMEFRKEGSYDVLLQLSKPNSQGVKGAVIYNKDILQAYNSKNGTTFKAFPKTLVSFSGNGQVEVKAHAVASDPVKVSVKTSPEIDGKETYVIPLSTTLTSGAVPSSSTDLLLFVNDLSSVPSTAKSTGIQIVSCMEVNDTNPLNNLSLKLKNSDKYLVDMVILFSSNINYDAATAKVKVTHNPNVTHLLANSAKYLKPLQDKGMKVILSILGNHDRAGVANLSDAAAKAFAQELKAVCEAYNLDGVFFDDEYSAYQNPVPPGFVSPSYRAAARLVYETKMAMPNKLTMVYVYSRTGHFGGNNAIAEAEAGQYVDYALHDYGGGYDLSSNYPGLPKSRWGMYSGEYSLNRYPSVSSLNALRNGNYGAHMIFAFDPKRPNFDSRQKPALQNLAKILFDDDLLLDESQVYSKDW
ncbi:BT_3987 domain-containing protein [Sphingobacterium sp. Mn56C]|uniref:BT_3987 domain-containing protein n=1 Tax=Sphingobacterium sp. Mn56C TaxID=3395261 RepID=UPI003BE65F39